jgi:ABC-type bacteriocin/lantibiotic exporter with double-glycine peptidase domain
VKTLNQEIKTLVFMLDSNNNDISKSKFVFQRGMSDCGVACLMSMLQIRGGNCHYETILKKSKCNVRGTNIIGLQNAAKFYNFKVDAFTFENFNELKNTASFPCILLIKKYFIWNHYIICCDKPTDKSTLIFDPSRGFSLWGNNYFVKVWKLKIAVIITGLIPKS